MGRAHFHLESAISKQPTAVIGATFKHSEKKKQFIFLETFCLSKW